MDDISIKKVIILLLILSAATLIILFLISTAADFFPEWLVNVSFVWLIFIVGFVVGKFSH